VGSSDVDRKHLHLHGYTPLSHRPYATGAVVSTVSRLVWTSVLQPASLPPLAILLFAVVLFLPVVLRRTDLAAPAVALAGIVAALAFHARTAPFLGRVASDEGLPARSRRPAGTLRR
jgi:hypothetical protein